MSRVVNLLEQKISILLNCKYNWPKFEFSINLNLPSQVKALVPILPSAEDAENFEFSQVKDVLLSLEGVKCPFLAGEKLKSLKSGGLDKDVSGFLEKIICGHVQKEIDSMEDLVKRITNELRVKGLPGIDAELVQKLENHKKDLPRHGKLSKAVREVVGYGLEIASSGGGRDLHGRFSGTVNSEGRIQITTEKMARDLQDATLELLFQAVRYFDKENIQEYVSYTGGDPARKTNLMAKLSTHQDFELIFDKVSNNLYSLRENGKEDLGTKKRQSQAPGDENDADGKDKKKGKKSKITTTSLNSANNGSSSSSSSTALQPVGGENLNLDLNGDDAGENVMDSELQDLLAEELEDLDAIPETQGGF